MPGDPEAAVLVDLWRVALDGWSDDAVWRLEANLSEPERRRADRLISPGGARRWIVARGALRELLARYLDDAPVGLRFAEGEKGKPLLVTDTDLRFNIAHSDGVALVGVARGRDVGVDVERIRTGVRELDVARRVLGDAAVTALADLEPAARTASFFRLWVRHEAAVKCRGVGLVAAINTDVAGGLLIGDVEIGHGYAAAWALDADGSVKAAATLRDWDCPSS